ncbi:MAG TPA: VOC family protein [Nitrospiraceae bacterium]|nr:VOC family protein [Nitrospiraceae bacterium]
MISRLLNAQWFRVAVLCSALSTQHSALAAAEPPVTAESVASIGFTVSDMDRSVAFYRDVLTFKPVSDMEVDGPEYDRFWGVFGSRVRLVRMQLGEQTLELVQFLSPPDARPIPLPSHSNDLWFQHIAIVVRDMDQAWAHLKKHHVRQISPRPQTIPVSNTAAAGIRAIKFRDPDGHNLELLWFPEGKGRVRWHQPGADLFLGIDHTAITVRNTDQSLRFYRDLLGLVVAGGSLNVGTEQEHLDSLPEARVRVTGLKTETGLPGVEFLEYERPAGGRPMPADTRPTDLWHWHVTIVVPDADAAATNLCVRASCVSPRGVRMPDRALGFRQGFLVRDPDGHVLQLVSR